MMTLLRRSPLDVSYRFEMQGTDSPLSMIWSCGMGNRSRGVNDYIFLFASVPNSFLKAAV